MAIELTERAAQEVKMLIEQNSLPADNSYLRMGVKGGGCSGFSYALDLTENKNENDEEWESHGVKVIWLWVKCDVIENEAGDE